MTGMVLLFALTLIQQIGPPKPAAVGGILVATGKSHDPDLAESVVLLIHSDRDGAMGLILNRPRGKSMYFGGPIALGVRALFQSRTQPADGERILDGVYMVSKESSTPKDAMTRAYAGYVGWSAQQLNDEISRGLWKVVHAGAAIVFDPHPETLWRRVGR
jgi:putative transcriptional regulator